LLDLGNLSAGERKIYAILNPADSRLQNQLSRNEPKSKVRRPGVGFRHENDHSTDSIFRWILARLLRFLPHGRG